MHVQFNAFVIYRHTKEEFDWVVAIKSVRALTTRILAAKCTAMQCFGVCLSPHIDAMLMPALHLLATRFCAPFNYLRLFPLASSLCFTLLPLPSHSLSSHLCTHGDAVRG